MTVAVKPRKTAAAHNKGRPLEERNCRCCPQTSVKVWVGIVEADLTGAWRTAWANFMVPATSTVQRTVHAKDPNLAMKKINISLKLAALSHPCRQHEWQRAQTTFC